MQDQCESLLCKLVKDFGTPEWKKQPRIHADKLCQYISRVKSSMHTWHAGSPQVSACALWLAFSACNGYQRLGLPVGCCGPLCRRRLSCLGKLPSACWAHRPT